MSQRTECNACVNRFKNNRFCKKDDSVETEDWFDICLQYEIDFTRKPNSDVKELSTEFLSRKEERTAAKFSVDEGFQDYCRNGGAWDFSQTPSVRLFKEKT